VLQLEVAELVRQHRFDLGGARRDSRVSKNTMRLLAPKPEK
jgi:hypothetical protein